MYSLIKIDLLDFIVDGWQNICFHNHICHSNVILELHLSVKMTSVSLTHTHIQQYRLCFISRLKFNNVTIRRYNCSYTIADAFTSVFGAFVKVCVLKRRHSA